MLLSVNKLEKFSIQHFSIRVRGLTSKYIQVLIWTLNGQREQKGKNIVEQFAKQNPPVLIWVKPTLQDNLSYYFPRQQRRSTTAGNT